MGEHLLFEGQARAVQRGESRDTLSLEGVPLRVDSVLEGGDTLRGPRAPASWPGLLPRWLWLLLVPVIAVAAGLLARRLARRPRAAVRVRLPPAHERALDELRALREKRYIEDHQPEPFYVELSGIVRRYLENRFGLHAPESTTEEEMRETVESPALTDDQRERTAVFLAESDLVKFARHEPEEEDMRRAFQAAETLVRETIPNAGEAAS